MMIRVIYWFVWRVSEWEGRPNPFLLLLLLLILPLSSSFLLFPTSVCHKVLGKTPRQKDWEEQGRKEEEIPILSLEGRKIFESYSGKVGRLSQNCLFCSSFKVRLILFFGCIWMHLLGFFCGKNTRKSKTAISHFHSFPPAFFLPLLRRMGKGRTAIIFLFVVVLMGQFRMGRREEGKGTDRQARQVLRCFFCLRDF